MSGRNFAFVYTETASFSKKLIYLESIITGQKCSGNSRRNLDVTINFLHSVRKLASNHDKARTFNIEHFR